MSAAYNLGVGSGSHTEQTAAIVSGQAEYTSSLCKTRACAVLTVTCLKRLTA